VTMSDPKEVADLVARLNEQSDWVLGAGEIKATFVHVSAILAEAATTLQSLSADLERVTAERDEVRATASHNADVADFHDKLAIKWHAEFRAAEARISTLTEALRKIASDEVETAFMFRLIASEALGALPTQGEQP